MAPTRASRRLSAPAPGSLCSIKFFASIRRSPARCASAWRLRAATACADLARHARRRFRACATPNISRRSGRATSPAGRVHRLWRLFASRPLRLDAPTLRIAADLARTFRTAPTSRGSPTPCGTSSPAPSIRSRRPRARAPRRCNCFATRRRVDAEIFALWLAGPRLGATTWLGRAGSAARDDDRACVLASRPKRQASAPGRCGLGRRRGRRLCDGRPRGFRLGGRAVAPFARSSLAAQPKLRAKGAGRVVELLLGDDAVSPARAAKLARLSDRAARRLFDRLIELGAVRELSGRPNFRLYGL